MSPLFQAITMSEDRIQVRHHDSWRGDWKPNDLPVTDRCVVDFLYLCTKKGKTVPCLLNEAQFGCMVNVQRPHTQMYYSPGITAVPFEKFRDICLRAKEKGVEIHLKRIDPNSLGQQLVLCIGRDVTDRGRPTAEPDE